MMDSATYHELRKHEGETDLPAIDAEMMAIARVEEILAQFNDIGQRRRIFAYLVDKLAN